MFSLSRLFLNNIGVKIISIAVAVILWIVVLGSRIVEVTKDIPVEIITPADIIPANEVVERVAFRLSGPKAFLRAILDRKEDPIRINLEGSKPNLITYRFFSDSIRLPIGVKVLSINPAAVLIKLEYLRRREIPVRPFLRGSPPEGFKIIKTEIKPSTIKIKGAESRVDSLTEILSTPIDVSYLKQSIERDVGLELTKLGVQLEGPLPRVSIQIEPLSANFRIKNVDVRVLSNHKVRVEEKSVTVLVRADARDIKYIDRAKVFGAVDLRGKPKGRYEEPVKITLPEELGLVRVIPEKIHITLF